jgi:hypothetical protein
MDAIARYNWTLAKLLVAALLTAVFLGGVGFLGMVGYTAYSTARESNAAQEKEHRLDDEERKMAERFHIRRLD